MKHEATTSLGSIEERLRRSLDLVGTIGTLFKPKDLTPVVIADDATRPGCNVLRNRSWGGAASNPTVAGGSSNSDYLVAVDDLIVTGILVQVEENPGDLVRFRYAVGAPEAVLPVGVVPVTFAVFTERGGVAPAPIGRDNTAAVIAAGFAPFCVFDVSSGGSYGGIPADLGFGIFIPRGGSLVVEGTGDGSYLVNVFGKTF